MLKKRAFKSIISFDKSRIYYYITRNNRSSKFLVFLHGLGCNNSFFKHEEFFFANLKFNVINVDLRGHGFSDNFKSKLYIEDFAKDLWFILKKEKVRKAVLIGHSMGGFIVLRFYSFKPSLVEKIILIASSYAINFRTLKPSFIFSGFLASKLVKLIAHILNPGRTKDLDFSKYRGKDKIYLIYYSAACTTIKDMREATLAMIREDLSPVLGTVKVPTLIIYDRYDHVFSKESYLALHQGIPCSLLRIEAGDHDYTLQNPGVIEKDILKFINS